MVRAVPGQNKRLQLLLVAPLSRQAEVAVGEVVEVVVAVTAEGTSECVLTLGYDGTLFTETSGLPNPRRLAGDLSGEQVRWQLRAVAITPQPQIVSVEATADGLVQRVEFSVEVR